MVQEAAGGSLWILVTVIGVAVLAIAMIYGTISWTRRRRQRAPGTVERVPGPAPQGARSGADDFAAADGHRPLPADARPKWPLEPARSVPSQERPVSRDPDTWPSEDDVQRASLGPRGVPNEPVRTRMTPAQKKKIPTVKGGAPEHTV